MLRFRVIVVDRTRSPFLREGERFYLERLRRYVKTEWMEVKPARMTKGRPPEEAMREEGQALLKRIREQDFLVPLDRSGTEYDSLELADWLGRLAERSSGTVCFLVGGALGHSREVLKASGKVLSLSRLTLTHEMTRLVLLEQLYRACTILEGENYHK
ncbi:MAG: 23S rRNA (pseudouridine(1915)-N(3))-methyltransferase RlmH [Desulfobacteraceae bacterium]|jgi:23S rRNA (pseudouridine1915-N3)-methyltransferase